MTPDRPTGSHCPIQTAPPRLAPLPVAAVCAVLAAVCGWAPPLAAVEGATNIAEEGLLSDDPATAEAAFAAQAHDPSHHARLRQMLSEMLGRLAARTQAEEQSLKAALQAGLQPADLDRLAGAGRAHHTAAQKTLEFIFDNRRYPVSPKAETGWMPGYDVQPGQAEMETRYAAALEKYDQVEALYCGQVLKLLAALEPGADRPFAADPQPPLPEYLQAVARLQPSEPPPPALDRLTRCEPVAQYKLRAPDLAVARLFDLLNARSRRLRLLQVKLAQLIAWRDRLQPSPAAVPVALVVPVSSETAAPADADRATPLNPCAALPAPQRA
ncbi:MAG: hypothetical protein ACREJ2_00465, partial [Planctomycetota bacterium]